MWLFSVLSALTHRTSDVADSTVLSALTHRTSDVVTTCGQPLWHCCSEPQPLAVPSRLQGILIPAGRLELECVFDGCMTEEPILLHSAACLLAQLKELKIKLEEEKEDKEEKEEVKVSAQ